MNVSMHKAIRALYPNAICVEETTAFDEDGNVIDIDLLEVETKAAEIQAEEDSKKQAAQAKLAKLGLTPDDLKALLG